MSDLLRILAVLGLVLDEPPQLLAQAAALDRPQHRVAGLLGRLLGEGLVEAGVELDVLGVVESLAPAIERYDPGNPQANDQGIVYAANVNAMEEMANMISASRSYQSNLEVINTAKALMLRTLALGQG